MRLVSIYQAKPGMVLAKPVYSDTGVVLIGEKIELSQSMIERLKRMGIENIYIHDHRTDDIELPEVISAETRKIAMETIRKSFQEYVVRGNWRNHFQAGKMERSFRISIEMILNDLIKNKQALDLVSQLYTTDEYLYMHSFNVTVYTIALGLKKGLNEKELMDLGMGAILHDIGKMNIPNEILNKPGKLTSDEFEEVKRHTVYGFEFLRKQENISLVSAHMAYQHHERLNGSGYPRGIKGEEIHPYARILAVADVYDALTTNRVYRKALLPHEALETLYVGSGDLFEQSVVELFRDTVAIYPLGQTVRLSTGEAGIVVDYNHHALSRPIVRVVKDANEQEIEPYEVDLSKQINIMITRCGIEI